jgi:quercetin dioxygenase-like cupin family protein
MSKTFRRVVTGHDVNGKSILLIEDEAPHVFTRGAAGVVVRDLWETVKCPADNRGHDDAVHGPFHLAPPKGGSIFRVIEYPPDAKRFEAMATQNEADFRASGMAAARDVGAARHRGFHKTNTIDYAIVLSGEIWAMMDEGETLLRAGDTLIQRGTNHAWSNRSTESAWLAFVLIDAEPV